jgi:hypothetical protein
MKCTQITLGRGISCLNSNLKKRRFRTIQDVVDDYVSNRRSKCIKELHYYRNQPSLIKAIEVAALAKTHDGKKHDHQCRIPVGVLKQAQIVLVSIADELRACKTFSELYDRVALEIGKIKGIGKLTIYDTAHRIGAYLGLEPEFVYVHAGVKKGAKALGFKGRSIILKEELPKEFDKLKPYEIEDCLCIYADNLEQIYADNNRQSFT